MANKPPTKGRSNPGSQRKNKNSVFSKQHLDADSDGDDEPHKPKLKRKRIYFPLWEYFPVGKMSVEEVIVDEKGRVLIPKKAREKIGLQAGGKARLKVEKERIIIMPPVSPEEFIQEMEGCIKEGKQSINPLELKKMWETLRKHE
jgi:AbrB family looped-hinge helix DNA binding protein